MKEVTKKAFYQKWWFWVIVAIVVIASYGGGSEDTKQPTEKADKSTNVTKEEPKEKQPEVAEKTNTSENEKTMTKAEFEQIQNDMSYEEVVKIIGSEGELQSESTVGDYTSKLYTWKGEGGLGANANITFSNNKVQAKSQFGLK
ncbi:hypothetical protein CN399_08485 [Bacillus cereus]|jgi:hypothetical protein|uniref:DUF3862 domain-containing protein n=1 Tax=Bacillus cereus TaxID=1396 RepID=UPI000BF958ED|nr:DUF3862 domain-containing protein [Bacillus cereus]PFB16989.1 hypothetical protein CN399_08485 [Bacillus cereus]